MSSTSYRISTSVISGGGGSMSSTNFHSASTLGQPSALGETSSLSYIAATGFWHTLLLRIVGDTNGDGAVDLKDVITTLQVVTGQTPETIRKVADADGDGRIGLGEAIMILRKLSILTGD